MTTNLIYNLIFIRSPHIRQQHTHIAVISSPQVSRSSYMANTSKLHGPVKPAEDHIASLSWHIKISSGCGVAPAASHGSQTEESLIGVTKQYCAELF